MTVFADISRGYMLQILARRISTVVAADAITGDIRVIDRCGQPAGGRMTVVATIVSR